MNMVINMSATAAGVFCGIRGIFSGLKEPKGDAVLHFLSGPRLASKSYLLWLPVSPGFGGALCTAQLPVWRPSEGPALHPTQPQLLAQGGQRAPVR